MNNNLDWLVVEKVADGWHVWTHRENSMYLVHSPKGDEFLVPWTASAADLVKVLASKPPS